jgi:hypothetical protein
MFDLATTCRAITPFFAKKRYPICEETVSKPRVFCEETVSDLRRNGIRTAPFCEETVSDLRRNGIRFAKKRYPNHPANPYW